MQAHDLVSAMAAVCLWGGAAWYLFDRPERINPIPWLVWAMACLVASWNTAMEEGFSRQAIIYAVTGAFFLAVVGRRWNFLCWGTLPRWQKMAMPLLLASPVAAVVASPAAGMALQVAFSWTTAVAFMETAAKGYSKDPIVAWWIELAGCLLLLAANDWASKSWILPLNSSAVTVACIAAIYAGRGRARGGGAEDRGISAG